MSTVWVAADDWFAFAAGATQAACKQATLDKLRVRAQDPGLTLVYLGNDRMWGINSTNDGMNGDMVYITELEVAEHE